MKLSHFTAYLALAASTLHAASLPSNALAPLENRAVSPRSEDVLSPENILQKRKGGGGRGGGGGGGGSSSGGGARTGSGGSTAGRTSASYGGGRYYGGGASTPYKAGGKTPGRNLSPGLLLGGVAVLAIMPGLWLYSVYPYHFNNPYRFRNQSAVNNTDNSNNNDNDNTRKLRVRQTTAGAEESLPVLCLCQQYQDCGCEENDDQANLNELVGNGSYAALNKSLVTVSDVNGTRTLVLNGSLPNGTAEESAATMPLAFGGSTAGYWAGYWVAGLIVVYTCAGL